ncbi:M20/M25/M40 family metallo-hydrolase [Psychrobium sp. 1_MG-2023]|uniref:M20/M25/M40 family metallo-hydrolase n=1 Tax=Psychrobium sp. 1_MG-2023 TaxID=3062624 RepID=UPI0026B97F79|nr:M20/M25/M40 family metallo-hydrolase [Psychrobium sp. 1_MG-2023]MDP2561209.1 M20/M25/M40 family metallo-hydrolase [Psychrobium sp. 1_MG-2023]
MKRILPLALMMTVTACSFNKPPSISQPQVVADITYLASDELKGRGNFTPGITQAAEFISQRFNDIGLKPFSGLDQYQQEFVLYNITSQVEKLQLNGQTIAAEQVAIATSKKQLSWTSPQQANIVLIGADDDFRAQLSVLNQVGKDALVLVDPAHKKTFLRYQAYFNRGLNKFNHDQGGSLVLALTEINQVNELNLSTTSHVKQQKLANVVGVLPGKSKEMVLFSAHYDHLGMDESKEGDKIYNGADDDASGTAAVINLAQYYAQQGTPERTLVFVAFTAEEIGGYGSKYFSTHINPESIAAMVNIEMIGKPSKFGAGGLWMTGFERSNLAQIMNKSLAAQQLEIHPDPYPKQRLFYRSDNATLARLGVPAHSFSSTQLESDKHYHQLSDDLASLDLDSMTKVINALAVGSQPLVDGVATPTRVDTSKVKSGGLIY